MKVGDLVKIRGRSNKDYGLVIKANKKGDVIDVFILGGTWKDEVWYNESFGWEVISESR
jgi:hypothetical protein|tara:strand:- start:1255 stop:1431 length:177 start_codon:yes stop_codon:yes gene_type:complete